MRPIELDVLSQGLVGAAISEIIAENGQVDFVVHNAGHDALGPAETFTPEQYAELHDIDVPRTPPSA